MDGRELKDILLGGQDGLVNVLGVIIAVAAATVSAKVVIIAGIAAGVAESLSMAGVGYTSIKAYGDYVRRKLQEEQDEAEHRPDDAKQDIIRIFKEKGFSGALLSRIVRRIAANKKVMVQTMMHEEFGIGEGSIQNPSRAAWVIGLAAFIGSMIPLLPFLFIKTIPAAMTVSVIISLAALFGAGFYKAKTTIGNPWRSGLEIALIGSVIVLLSWLIGHALSFI